MDFQNSQDDDGFQENGTSQGDGSNGEGTIADIVYRIELEVHFCSEKLLNLQMLLMEIAHRAYDIEALMLDPDSLSSESLEKAFEFDVLYGILDSEVSELEKLVSSVRVDIGIVKEKVNEEGSEGMLKGRLHAATESLKQMQEVIAAVRTESAYFDKAIDPFHRKAGTSEGGAYENGHASSHTTMQAEDQRNVLHMLQQSIARELDFEKKLCDSGDIVEELRIKLHHVEQESYFLEESVEVISERMFAAENASELFLGTSKELIDRINIMQSKLSASGRREGDLKSKLEQSLVQFDAVEGSSEMMQHDSEKNASKEAMQSQRLSTSEFLTLHHKVQKLEEWLSIEANQKEQNIPVSEISRFENIFNDIKDAISKAESRTQNTEARCAELTHTNIQLNGELNSLKSQGSDRAGLLEQRLMESEGQLEHARASVEALDEQQGMLRSEMSDMLHVIEDQKEKYLKTETRAESAESKCTLLTDTNLELSEELSFLRSRVESLENSLRHANRLNLSTAKDISIKTKSITALVAKLALERERLHIQIVALTKKNRMLAQKCKQNVNGGTLLSERITATEGGLTNLTEEVLLTYSPMHTKVKTKAGTLEENEAGIAAPPEDESFTLETVRSIEPTLLSWKYILAALFFLLAAALLHILTQSTVPSFK